MPQPCHRFTRVPRAGLALGIALAAGIALCACTIERYPRGFYLDEEFAEGITPGFDSQGSVQLLLGRPTITNTFDQSSWYYISEVARRRSFSKAKAVERNILAVHFDEQGMVTEVQRYTLADGRDVNFRSDETPTRGKKLGIFEQIFSNIGRFSNLPGQGPGPQQ